MAHACNPSYSRGWSSEIAWTQEVEVVASQDCTTVLHPGQQSKIWFKKKKIWSQDTASRGQLSRKSDYDGAQLRKWWCTCIKYKEGFRDTVVVVLFCLNTQKLAMVFIFSKKIEKGNQTYHKHLFSKACYKPSCRNKVMSGRISQTVYTRSSSTEL